MKVLTVKMVKLWVSTPASGRTEHSLSIWEVSKPLCTLVHSWILLLCFLVAFAVNLQVLLAKPDVYINHKSEAGMLETTFLTSLGLTPSQLEAKARDCKEVKRERERRECNIIISSDIRVACKD